MFSNKVACLFSCCFGNLILVSMGASLLFSLLPVVSGISSGFKIIILTVLIAGGAAFLFPVKEETENE